MGSLSVALFDTCTDGFAIEISPEKHYGRVQSIMISGKAVGFIMLSLVFGYMVQKSSYSAIFIIIGLLMMIPFVFVVFASEPAEIRKRLEQLDRRNEEIKNFLDKVSPAP